MRKIESPRNTRIMRTSREASTGTTSTSDSTVHQVNSAHIVEGGGFISILSPRDQVCPGRTAKTAGSTALTHAVGDTPRGRKTHAP